MRIISGECSGGVCPTVYEDDNGDIYVQGFVAPDARRRLKVPDGEDVVRINRELFESLRAG
jgi:hypothetical protein